MLVRFLHSDGMMRCNAPDKTGTISCGVVDDWREKCRRGTISKNKLLDKVPLGRINGSPLPRFNDSGSIRNHHVGM